MAARVSLLRQMRLLGPLRGWRVWRTLTAGDGVPAERLPEQRIHHGKKPDLPAISRRR